MTIDDENVENIPHQDVIKKLRLLNEEATNSITLCVLREEVRQGNSKTMKVWTWSNFIYNIKWFPCAQASNHIYWYIHVLVVICSLRCTHDQSIGVECVYEYSMQDSNKIQPMIHDHA